MTNEDEERERKEREKARKRRETKRFCMCVGCGINSGECVAVGWNCPLLPLEGALLLPFWDSPRLLYAQATGYRLQATGYSMFFYGNEGYAAIQQCFFFVYNICCVYCVSKKFFFLKKKSSLGNRWSFHWAAIRPTPLGHAPFQDSWLC